MCLKLWIATFFFYQLFIIICYLLFLYGIIHLHVFVLCFLCLFAFCFCAYESLNSRANSNMWLMYVSKAMYCHLLLLSVTHYYLWFVFLYGFIHLFVFCALSFCAYSCLVFLCLRIFEFPGKLQHVINVCI